MQAVILAGGKGSRLKPITDYVPKPLIPVNNVPIIEWQIRYLKKFKIDDVIICSGYKSDQMEMYLEHKKNFGIRVRHSKEQSPLGTGGAIKKAAKMINAESFFVLNGDVLTNIDLSVLAKQNNAVGLIELRTRFGTVEFQDSKITRFREKKPISGIWMNSGIYHLRKDIVKALPTKGAIEDTAFVKYAEMGKLVGVKFKDAFWYSIDSHKDLEECTAAMKSDRLKGFYGYAQ